MATSRKREAGEPIGYVAPTSAKMRLSSRFPGGSASTYAVALGDVNGDGFLDALVGNFRSANELLLGDGSGGFTASSSFPVRSWHAGGGEVERASAPKRA